LRVDVIWYFGFVVLIDDFSYFFPSHRLCLSYLRAMRPDMLLNNQKNVFDQQLWYFPGWDMRSALLGELITAGSLPSLKALALTSMEFIWDWLIFI
jgi:hypothetical protein